MNNYESYSKIILNMGNYIGGWMNANVVSEGAGTVASEVTLWDMLTHLVKQYIFSKVEQDEFLREYLMGSQFRMNFFQMGQRAITFDPLPSRIKYEDEEIKQERIRKRKKKEDHEIIPKETPYTRFRFEEISEDEEMIYYEETETDYSSSSESEEEYKEINPELALYSAYCSVSK